MSPNGGKVRYGIIGFGRFAGKSIAPAFRNSANSELVALQKRDAVAAREKAKAFGLPRWYSSAADLVLSPEIDAVYVASANVRHCEETLMAARAGKHVIVEKPMAMSAAEAERMIEECSRHRVKLMVGHMVRLSPLNRRIRDIVKAGGLGRIRYARAEFAYHGASSERKWLYDRQAAGGGPVFDIGVHCLDTLRFILDDEPVEVKASLFPAPTRERVEEVAEIALRFSNGTVASVYCSYASPDQRKFLEVIGDRGSASAPDFTVSGRTLTLTVGRTDSDGSFAQTVESVDVPDLYAEEITGFSDCILSGREPDLTAENGLRNQRILDAIMNP